jgi:hypothetical protein
MIMGEKPDPGSQEAVLLGCTCPPYNRQPIKETTLIKSNDYTQLVRKSCPIHGWINK